MSMWNFDEAPPPDAIDQVAPIVGLLLILVIGLWILFGDVDGIFDEPEDEPDTVAQSVRDYNARQFDDDPRAATTFTNGRRR